MKKLFIILAILAMASIASAQITINTTLILDDIPTVRAWLQEADYLQRCYTSVEDGGLGYPQTVAGEKLCLGMWYQTVLKTTVDRFTENKDASAAAATAIENAHKINPEVVVP